MRDAGGSRWIHYSDRAGCAGVRGSLRFSMDDQEITASRSGRKGSAKSGHKAAAIRTSEEETRLFYDRLRDAFEARFEQAAIYDRAGNQLRFLNRKTSGTNSPLALGYVSLYHMMSQRSKEKFLKRNSR
ncbi:uncharacterized protein LOC112552669 isoform X2 [Pogonomyrmex barbatus]|uniref:Uncharacterized protein LOC112552669 isoform X2 n=1 Tax=Pogonomyrmex barbatus TaxID=144034 RepID=A0A8N1S858_9HYME|nr:uncharacterized protein LOC112552669 isoform X2 [Pogonomyrmex barbatus]